MSGARGIAGLLAAAMLLAAPAHAVEVAESHPLLGGLVRIRLEAEDEETGHNRIRDAVTVAHRLEAMAAPAGDGDIAALNATAGRGARAVSLDAFRLLSFCRLMARSTGGAFDVTVGPLLRLRESGERAGRMAVTEALALVGSDRIVLEAPDRAGLAAEGMAVDMEAILHGYILGRMAAVLRGAGVAKALLEIGDHLLLAVGPPDGEAPFRVDVAHGRGIVGTASLRDQALSTTRSGRRGDDAVALFDPRSGRAVEANRQATVVALDAAVAEAWSTALAVDPDGALGLLDEPRDVEALVFDEHGEHATARFGAFARWKDGRPGKDDAR